MKGQDSFSGIMFISNNPSVSVLRQIPASMIIEWIYVVGTAWLSTYSYSVVMLNPS